MHPIGTRRSGTWGHVLCLAITVATSAAAGTGCSLLTEADEGRLTATEAHDSGRTTADAAPDGAARDASMADASAPTDATPPPADADAPLDASAGDAGGGEAYGVACGAGSCTPPAACCASRGALPYCSGGGTMMRCTCDGVGCTPREYECDGREDCGRGQLCCARGRSGQALPFETRCRTQCENDPVTWAFELCHPGGPSDQCLAGGFCVGAVFVPNGYGICSGT